jgi:hypothetical protein
MTLGELKGKGFYDLTPEEFEEHFCRYWVRMRSALERRGTSISAKD